MTQDAGCQDTQAELVALLDDQLGPDARERVEAHLADCPGCQAELAALRNALGVVDALPATAPAADLQARFEARLARERAGFLGASWAWLRRPVPALAMGSGLAALALVAVLVMRPGDLAEGQIDAAIVNNMELFTDYEAIQHLDLLEDMDVLEALDDEV